MKYMTDANISGLAKELRSKGIDCETVHKMMLSNEDTRIPIKDPQIVKFLNDQNKTITLITMDNLLAEYCKTFEIPCIRIQDLVSDHIRKGSAK
jgi:hypothetical protein